MKKQGKRSWLAFYFIIGICLCIFCPALVHAQTTEGRTIRVAFPVQEGMSYFHSDGTPDGYTYVYLEKIAEYTGWKMEYIPYDSDDQNQNILNAIDDLESGKVDLLGPMLQSSGSDYNFILNEYSYGTVYTTLCALEESNLREDNASFADILKVGLWKQAEQRNEEVLSYLNTGNFDYQIIYYDTSEAQYQALRDGEVDVISNLSLAPIEGTRIIEKFAPRPYYFASSTANKQLLDELDEAISTLNEVQPSLQDVLFERYFLKARYRFALTEEQKEFLSDLNEIKVLCVDHDAPYVYQQDGKPAGMLVAMLEDFAEETGLSIQYTFSQNKEEAEQKLKQEHYDILIGMNFVSKYCAEIGFVRSKSIMESNLAYLHKSNNCKHNTVAVESGLEDVADTTDFKTVITCDNAKGCIAAVESGNADYAIGDRSGLEYYLFEKYDSYSTSLITGNAQTICIAMARDSDLTFIRLMNDYIYSLSNTQKTTFLEAGNIHSYKPSLEHYIQQNPLQALVTGIVLTMILAVSFSMMYHAAKMRKKNRELQAANDVKSEFLTRMSHDIRTPMNGIIGMLDISDKFADDPAAVRRYHQKIRIASEYLLSLINDVLDMSKLDSEDILLTEESVYLRDILESCHEILAVQAAEHGMEFCTPGIGTFDPPRVFASELHLRQIVMNIVSNAIKYNKPNGKIIATAYVDEQTEDTVTCRFVVEDTGIGMSEEFQKHMFEPFSQEHGKVRSEFKGTGLGLSIVKKLIDKMGGEIHVESRQGEGTRFVWTLTFQIDKDYVPAETSTVIHDVQLEGRRILAAEDNALNTEILQFMLNEIGAKATLVDNGQKAVEEFARSEPGTYDLILMDIMMPVMDGYTASRRIRSMDRPDADKIPIIALTANAFAEDALKSAEAGMNAHITKPIDAGKLKECMIRLLSENE